MKRVVITGGNGDIAKAIKDQIQDSYLVLLPDRKQLNVKNWPEIKKYFEQKKPDILINNAGFINPSPIYSSFPYDWFTHFEINLFGAYLCSKAAINNGCTTIINIGSTSAIQGRADWSAYCASKAALVSLTESISAEGTRCVCVSPGRTKTKMRKRLFPDEDPDTLLLPSEFAYFVGNVLTNIPRWDGVHVIVKKEGSQVKYFIYGNGTVKIYVAEGD